MMRTRRNLSQAVLCCGAHALVLLLMHSAAPAQDVRAPRWWLDRASAEIDRFPDIAEKGDPSLEALDIKWKQRRAELLAVLADTQARLGERDAALRSVAACENAMRKTPSPEYDAHLNAQIAGIHARFGDLPAANRSVDAAFAAFEQFAKIDPKKAEGRRDSLESYLIWQFASAGAYDQALARARKVASASDRASRLKTIAELQHKAGAKDVARKTMAEAEAAARQAMKEANESDRDLELSLLCGSMINIDDLVGAERIAAELLLETRVNTYTTLAAKHHDAKNAVASKRLGKVALDGLRMLPADGVTVKLEAPRLAGFFMFIGDKASAEQALAMVKTSDSALLNTQMHYGVARLHAQNGDVAAAREQIDLARKSEAADRASATGETSSLLATMQPWPAKVAQAHVNAGHPEEASRVVELYKDDEIYAPTLRMVIVLSKAAAGDLPGVKQGLDSLDPGLFSREIARGEAIKALLRNADEQRLRDMATWFESLPDAQQRIGSYLMVCDALAK